MVVAFLSTLGEEAQTGGVHRMLGVCSEFEKIAKKVIDKAEREHAMRRKRKNNGDASTEKPAKTNTVATQPQAAAPKPSTANATATAAKPRPPQTARPVTSSSTTPHATTHQQLNGHLSPSTKSDHMTPERAYSPMTATRSHENSPAYPPVGWTDDFTAQNGANDMDFSAAFPDTSFADLTGFGSIAAMNAAVSATAIPQIINNAPGLMDMQSPPIGANGVFQQPMLPADLFSLPMTLDWDWAEMSGGAYPSVENGNFGGFPRS